MGAEVGDLVEGPFIRNFSGAFKRKKRCRGGTSILRLVGQRQLCSSNRTWRSWSGDW